MIPFPCTTLRDWFAILALLLAGGCVDYSKLSRGLGDGGTVDDQRDDAGMLVHKNSDVLGDGSVWTEDGAVIADNDGAVATAADGAIVHDMTLSGDMARPCVASLGGAGTKDFVSRFRITTLASVVSTVAYQRSDCGLPTSDFWSINMDATGVLNTFAENGDPYPKYASNGGSVSTAAHVNDGNPHDVVLARTSGNFTATVDGVASGSGSMPASFRGLPALGIGSGDPCAGDNAMAPGSITNFCLQVLP